MVVSSEGGQPQPLVRFSSRAWFYTKPAWSADSRHIAFGGLLDPDEGRGQPTTRTRILLYSSETGQTRLLIDHETADQIRHPVFSPDGSTLAFVRDGVTYTVPLGDSLEPSAEPRLVLESATWRLCWSPGGQRFYFYESDRFRDTPLEEGIWSINAFGETDPQFVRGSFGESIGLDVGLGPSGSLRAVVSAESQDLDIARVSLRGGEDTPAFIRTNQTETWPRYSPGGTGIAFQSNRSGADAIWITDGEGRQPRQLTADGVTPIWSPEGGRIAYHRHPENGWEINIVSVDEGGSPRPLAHGRRPGWSPDGRWIYYRSEDGGGPAIWRLALDEGSAEELIRLDGITQGEIFASPDGRTLYARQNPKLLKIPLGEDGRPSGEAEVLAEDVSGFSLLELDVYYCTVGGELKRYDAENGETVTVRMLDGAVSNNSGCSVSPDGEWLLYAREVRTGFDLVLLESVE